MSPIPTVDARASGGLLLSLVGAIAVGLSLMQHAFLGFLGGLVLFGLGVGAGQQLRLAAADLYPRAGGRKVSAMSSWARWLSPRWATPDQRSADDSATARAGASGPRLAAHPFIVLPSLGLVWLIHPDPKEIAANLSAYYPGQAVALRLDWTMAPR